MWPRMFPVTILCVLLISPVARANEANLSGTIYPGQNSGAGGPVFVLVSDNPVFPGGNVIGSQLLADAGNYRIPDLPWEVDLYLHAVYDADNSESYTVGDWKGSYSPSPFRLPYPLGTVENTGYDVTLTTEVSGASVSGNISYANYSTGEIYVGALDSDENLISQTTLAAPGPYTIPNLPVDGQFWFYAYVDTDDSGPTGPTGSDPIGGYPANPVTVSSSGMSGVDIDLQPPNNISGRIYENGTNAPVAGACVRAETDRCGGGLVGTATTQADGTYELLVPQGEYYIRTDADCDGYGLPANQYYVDEVYDGVEGTPICEDGVSITVGPDAPGIDFSLIKGGTISGTIYDNAGAPVTGYGEGQGFDLWVHVYTGDCASMNYVGRGDLSSDGTFITGAVSPGEYKLHTHMGDSPYLDEHWASPTSDTDCGNAQTFTVSAGTDNPGKDFQLDPAATITGTVTAGSPASGVSGLMVEARTPNDGQITRMLTAGDGSYSLKVPLGQYIVLACASCDAGGTSFPYVDEYWDNQANVDNAAIVDVSISDKFDINFFLAESYSPTDPEEADLAEIIEVLRILTGTAPDGTGSLIDDVDGDGRIGLAEAIYASKFVIEKPRIPSLVLMAAKGVDTLDMAWIPGSDGATPVGEVEYNIYLATEEDFNIGPATLKKSVTGTNQTEITGLQTGTLYYGKVVAIYSGSTSLASNSLQAKTYSQSVQQDDSTIVALADDLHLGQYTTSDGVTYLFEGGSPPEIGSALFSENTEGEMTLRTVDSASSSGGAVTVSTSEASLADVLDRGSIYTSFQLFDVASQAQDLPAADSTIATAESTTDKDGSRSSRLDWKDRLLSVEQTDFAYDEDTFSLQPQGKSSTMTLMVEGTATSGFTASVTADFTPELITTAEWGGAIIKKLESATVAARGTLSLTARASYDFSAAGSAGNEFLLFKRKYVSVYSAGPVPVYQEVTLSMNVAASAEAQVALQAMAQTEFAETVEVGARYDGSAWTPYISHGESSGFTASLDIAGAATAEIRVIPRIDVAFYKVLNSSLTVEPFARSNLDFEQTTNNPEFQAAHPSRSVQPTIFDASVGLESNVSVNLSALGQNWDVLPGTCVLGTGDCLYGFSPIELFSIPQFELSVVSSDEHEAELILQVTDGTSNEFRQDSLTWEVFPGDASVLPGSCSRYGDITTCQATVEIGPDDRYTVFASGYGRLGEVGRQFVEKNVAQCSRIYWEDSQMYESDCYYPNVDEQPDLTITRFESDDSHFYLREFWDNDTETAVYWSFSAGKLSAGNYDVISSWSDDREPYLMTGTIEDNDVCPSRPPEYPDHTTPGFSSYVIDQNTADYLWRSACLYYATEADKNAAKTEAYNYALDLIDEEISNQIYDGACRTWWNYTDDSGKLHECGY